jgi:hypothetical protein
MKTSSATTQCLPVRHRSSAPARCARLSPAAPTASATLRLPHLHQPRLNPAPPPVAMPSPRSADRQLDAAPSMLRGTRTQMHTRLRQEDCIVHWHAPSTRSPPARRHRHWHQGRHLLMHSPLRYVWLDAASPPSRTLRPRSDQSRLAAPWRHDCASVSKNWCSKEDAEDARADHIASRLERGQHQDFL